MKTITIHIDEDVFNHLVACMDLWKWAEDSVAPPDELSVAMMGVLKKIQEGKDSTVIAKKGKDPI